MNNEQAIDQLMTGASTSSTGSSIVKHTWEPLRLTHTKPSFTNEDAMLAARLDLWHKFIIFGVGNYEKTTILDAIVAASEPELLLPVMYALENSEKATFIGRCGISGVENLVKQGLRIKMPDGRTLGMDMVLGFVGNHELQINSQRVIYQALKSRYDSLRKYLNLKDFQNDQYLRYVYCSMSSPRVFHFVMRCCSIRILGSKRENKLSIRELNLSSNDITALVPFDKYFNYHLTKINLSHNAIRDVNSLRFFADFKITEIFLDGNPLCSRYATSEDYIRDVKNVFPHLQKLDGIVIGSETKFVPIMQINYLGDLSRIKLMKQFIRHFYALYDQDDRNVLNGLYDHEAFFSITLGSITNTTHHQMTKAFASNRNLLKFVDYAKCHEFLLRGPERIIAALRRQPPTYHNYKNFNIDLLHSTNESITIAIQGSFCYKEYPYAPLFFNRTFVIIESEDNEYCIANDQYHIQSETLKNSNNENKVGPINVAKIKPTIFSPTEKEQLLSFFNQRTTMNEEFSRRYLEDANWDIRVALSTFMKAYTVNDVAPEAFEEFYSLL